MKTKLLAAATALIICASPVLAGYEMECGAPVTLVGDDPTDLNPVVRVSVSYSGENRSWQVFHTLRNGAVISRSGQYGITDMTNSIKTQWQGKLLRQPWLYMIGELRKSDNNGYAYFEWLYDAKRGNALVMTSWVRCQSRQQQQLPTPTTQAPTQPYKQAAPASPPVQPNNVTTTSEPTQPQASLPQSPPPPSYPPPSSGGNKVPIIPTNGMVMIDVLLGGQAVRMVLDTGATLSTVTEAVAQRIVRDGQGTWQEPTQIHLADGRVSTVYVLLIRELRIGQHIVYNVRAGVLSSEHMLLAFPVVNSIAPFTIDTRARELVFHTAKG